MCIALFYNKWYTDLKRKYSILNHTNTENVMKKINLRKMLLSSLLLSIGMLLPLLTSQIKEIGDTLLPMHIPVMLCGLLCSPVYGLSVGLMLPFLRSLIFGMPPIYPNAVWMALELATYGFVIGLLYLKAKRYSIKYLYFCLLASMLAGRIVWGIAKAILLNLGGKAFTIAAFISGGFIDAFPGMILQLILIPLIMGILQKAKFKNSYKEDVK